MEGVEGVGTPTHGWGTDPGPLITPVDVVGWAVLLGLCGGGAGLAILLTALLCSCWRNKRENASKKHNFGVKRSWDQRNFLNFRKPTPVTIPEKGSHYLKKSPSPTGTRCPPGEDRTVCPHRSRALTRSSWSRVRPLWTKHSRKTRTGTNWGDSSSQSNTASRKLLSS